MKKNFIFLTVFALSVLLSGCKLPVTDEGMQLTAVGIPAEGELEPFRGEPFFRMQAVFNGASRSLRTPYLGVALDGTILALQTRPGHLRRSEDGGKTWGEIIEVPFVHMDSNFIPDENTGDIMFVRMWDGTDRLWRSSDHGKTWKEEKITLKPNEVMKWIEQAGFKKRVPWNERGSGYGTGGRYTMHANASESGITLRHGEKKGEANSFRYISSACPGTSFRQESCRGYLQHCYI